MRLRSTLAAFLIGVCLAYAAALTHIWALNRRWEWDAYNHGYGYFTFPITNPHKWTFHWFEKPPVVKPKTERI